MRTGTGQLLTPIDGRLACHHSVGNAPLLPVSGKPRRIVAEPKATIMMGIGQRIPTLSRRRGLAEL